MSEEVKCTVIIERLGQEECIVFEDATAGIEAAHNAEMIAIGVVS